MKNFKNKVAERRRTIMSKLIALIAILLLTGGCAGNKFNGKTYTEDSWVKKETVRLIGQMLNTKLNNSIIKTQVSQKSEDIVFDNNGTIVSGKIIEQWLIKSNSANVRFEVKYDVFEYKFSNLKIKKIVD